MSYFLEEDSEYQDLDVDVDVDTVEPVAEVVLDASIEDVEDTDEDVEPEDETESAVLVEPKQRKLYFINEIVEWQLTQYIWRGCVDVPLRDRIMGHATELIRQVIRKQGLYTIYPGQEESAFGDLLQTAWIQIERALYKYRSKPHCRPCFNPDRPNDSVLYTPGEIEYGIRTVADLRQMNITHCPKCGILLTSEPPVNASQGCYGGTPTVLWRGISKVFNMWSHVARTSILAYIKKEGRDHKNSGSYTTHLDNRPRPLSYTLSRFLVEARELCKYNEAHLAVLAALEELLNHDTKPHDGIIGKLVEQSGQPRGVVTSMIHIIRLRQHEFSDSPQNREMDYFKSDKRHISHREYEDDTI